MILDSLLATDLEALNIAYLFNGAMVLLNLPVPVMLFGKVLLAECVEGRGITQPYRIMAQLVF